MGTGIVLELDALADDQAADDVVSYAVVHGHTGVVVKGSQGTRWVRENAAELLSDAQSEGLQGAWLHYTEPAANAWTDEAAALIAAVGTLPLGLGIWVEIPESHGLDLGTLGEWVRELVASTSTPSRPVALIVTPVLALQLAGVSASPRWVLTEGDETTMLPTYATRRDAPLEVTDGLAVECYDLTSVRGLVPVAVESSTVPEPQASLPLEPEPESEPVTPEPEPEEEATDAEPVENVLTAVEN
jgi:hypothetical protein